MMPLNGPPGSVGSHGPQIINLAIHGGTSVNIFNLAGNPAIPVRLTVTVDGVIGTVNTGTPAFDWGAGWNTGGGSSFTLINNGTIVGAGGAGANQDQFNASTAPGSPGGPAMYLRGLTVNITNNGTSGGGGGGGGGAGASNDGSGFHSGAGGGGAGNPAGNPGATGGGTFQASPASGGGPTTGGNGGISFPALSNSQNDAGAGSGPGAVGGNGVMIDGNNCGGGGGGGGLGAAGGSGATSFTENGSGGGAAGAAILLQGGAANISGSGSVYGSVS